MPISRRLCSAPDWRQAAIPAGAMRFSPFAQMLAFAHLMTCIPLAQQKSLSLIAKSRIHVRDVCLLILSADIVC